MIFKIEFSIKYGTLLMYIKVSYLPFNVWLMHCLMLISAKITYLVAWYNFKSKLFKQAIQTAHVQLPPAAKLKPFSPSIVKVCFYKLRNKTCLVHNKNQ